MGWGGDWSGVIGVGGGLYSNITRSPTLING